MVGVAPGIPTWVFSFFCSSFSFSCFLVLLGFLEKTGKQDNSQHLGDPLVFKENSIRSKGGIGLGHVFFKHLWLS